MKKIFAYFISFLAFSDTFSVHAQDSIKVPLKIRVGVDIYGPVNYYINKNNLSTECFVSFDRTEKFAPAIEAGYMNYKFSQYNYDYLNKGAFIRLGVDINGIKPESSMGKYFAGVSLRYGFSLFRSEVPFFKHDNYWGSSSGSVPPSTYQGHFIEASPGMRTEIFNNISIGWTIRFKLLLYTSTGRNIRPVYFPGFGNGVTSFTTGINYYVIWNITYKERMVKLRKKEVPETTNPAEKKEIKP